MNLGEKKRKVDVFLPYKVYRCFAKHLATLNQNEKALYYYQLVQEFAKGEVQLIPILVERAKVNCGLGKLSDARDDADKVVALDENNMKAKLIDAFVLYEEDKFEEALLKYYQGLNLKQVSEDFKNGVTITRGTIEECVGINAGPIMDMCNLGRTIVNMKLKELNLLPPTHSISEVERRRKMKIFEAKKRCFSEKFLGSVAKEKHFMMDCYKAPGLFCGDQKNNAWLEQLLCESLSRLQIKEESLWRRKPLYTYAYQSTHPSPKLIEKLRETIELKRVLLEKDILRQLNEVNQAMLNNKWSECFFKGEKLREKLSSHSDELIPQKRDYLKSVFLIIGQMYLSMKTLIKHWDQSQNDRRILHLIGVSKRYDVSVELYRDSFHPNIHDFNKFSTRMLDALNLCDDHLETIYFCHELACCYSLQRQVDQMRLYARQCIVESKRLGNSIWYVNSLFLLARAEVQDGNLIDGQVTLLAIQEASLKFNLMKTAVFASRAIVLLKKEEDVFRLSGIEKREKALVRTMANNNLKFQAIQLIQRMNTLPHTCRMSIIPGAKPLKKKAKQVHKKQLPNEEQLAKTIKEKLVRRNTFEIVEDLFSANMQ